MVSGCEAGYRIGPVLICAAGEVVRYADIESSMFATSHEINVVHSADHLGLWIPGSGLWPAPE